MEAFTHKPEIDNSWTLFLDRDGVINVESVGSYVTNWDEFEFLEGAQEALSNLNHMFGNIVVVTNQRGVGKGIMTKETLKSIHRNMMDSVQEQGGRIDKVYSCTALSDEDHNRKPNVGMGYQAKEDFPEIDFKKSIMIGNSMSDMEFGKRLSMHTVFITTKHEFELPHDMIDEQYQSLLSWSKTLASAVIL